MGFNRNLQRNRIAGLREHLHANTLSGEIRRRPFASPTAVIREALLSYPEDALYCGSWLLNSAFAMAENLGAEE